MIKSTIFGIGLLVFSCLVGCATYTDLIEDGLIQYGSGRMDGALNSFAAAEAETGDTHLVQLEKGMTDLALDNPRRAVNDFTSALNRMDALTTGSAVRDAASYVLDDTVADYPGAPFEQISARFFLGLSYLMMPDPFENVSAACRDMDNKMEQIEAYYERTYQFGADGNEAEFSFQIPPVAKYFAALAAEQRNELDSAEIYLRQAIAGAPGCAFFRNEAERMKAGTRQNLVFVFALVGMVPHKIETQSDELTALLQGMKALYSIAEPENSPNAVDRVLFTAPVRIPGYAKRRPFWHGGFDVGVHGGASATTAMVADFDSYVRAEYEMMLPGILIRAAVRRAIKEAAGHAAGASMTEDGETAKLLGDLFASIASAAETIDTRSWCTLPREVHACRLQVAQETKKIFLAPRAANGARSGQNIDVSLDLSNTSPAFVLVIQPGKGMAPIVLVDEAHQPKAQP